MNVSGGWRSEVLDWFVGQCHVEVVAPPGQCAPGQSMRVIIDPLWSVGEPDDCEERRTLMTADEGRELA
jgi:hypothetical protein